MLKLTDRFNGLVLGRNRLRNAAQRLAIRGILRFRRSRLAMAELLSGIGIRYPARSRGEHAWTGRRMPDLDCGGARLYEELRDGRFVLVTREALTLDSPDVHIVRCGSLPGPAMVLVRPDGYVAWACDRMLTAAQTSSAIAEWCGGRSAHLTDVA